MRLFGFIVGVLGVLLVIGSFFSFFGLVLLGGLFSGSVAFAFALPIILIVLGAAMAYFGFYYKSSFKKGSGEIGFIVKWWIISVISILISNYIINKMMIINDFGSILFTSLIISIGIQAARSQNHDHFKLREFIFYFLVYSMIIWLMNLYVLPQIVIQTGIVSSLILGFVIAAAFMIFDKSDLSYKTLPWISVVLILILVVSNMSSISNIIPNEYRPQMNNQYGAQKGLPDEKAACPIANIIFSAGTPNPPTQLESSINSDSTKQILNNLINTNTWRVENNFGSCYKGKYVDQNPNWYYCDNAIVSRWDLSSSGTINYRWYTAMYAEWKPQNNDQSYVFNGFVCENGKKVTVVKGTTNYYVYDSRQGTQIKIAY